jgi:8-oxo-dGTP diphosphatase
MEFSQDGLASVAVDLLVFTIEEDRLKILTIRRQYPPFAGFRALPGVFVRDDETLDQAAQRGLREETGLEDIYFEQLYTWGAPDRDPRRRVISVSYLALVDAQRLRGFGPGLRTTGAELADVQELLTAEDLAFDHRQIIACGRERLAGKVEYTPIAFSLVPEEFTLPQLQRVYELLLGKPLYKANFRKKIAPLVEETDRSTSGDAHRPSKFYRLRTSE